MLHCIKQFVCALLLLMAIDNRTSATALVETTASADRPATFAAGISADLDILAGSTFRFWQRNGMDTDNGGFHATLDTSGKSIKPLDKGLVQTARHAWTFSYYHRLGAPATTDPSPARMARSAYEILVGKMLDKSTWMFHWSVSQDGRKVTNDAKVLYGQWFGMYATAMYGISFDDAAAKGIAMACFAAVDQAWHNSSTGGYNNLLSNSIGAAEQGLEVRARIKPGAVSLEAGFVPSTPDRIMPTDFNDVLHGIEALEMLYQATGDAVVKARLLELLHIICLHMPSGKDGLVFGEYIPAPSGQPWKRTPDAILNYGHMIEASWLVYETLDVLLAAKAISAKLAAQYQNAMLNLGAKAVDYGYDKKHGGFFDTGLPGKYPISDAKVWWTQAEGSVGLWNLYMRGGKNPMYLKMLGDTVNFIKKFLHDSRNGEQYWQVDSNGIYNPKNNPYPGIKGNRWKASYHTLRMLLLLPRRIRAGV